MSNWTDEKVEQLRELHAKALPYSVIARQLGFTKNAVIGKAHRLKLHCLRGNINDPYPLKPKKYAGVPSRHRTRERESPPVANSPASPYLETPEDELLTIFEVCDGRCRFPIGNPGTVGFGFCGQRTKGGSIYCEHHMAQCSHASPYLPRNPTPFS